MQIANCAVLWESDAHFSFFICPPIVRFFQSVLCICSVIVYAYFIVARVHPAMPYFCKTVVYIYSLVVLYLLFCNAYLLLCGTYLSFYDTYLFCKDTYFFLIVHIYTSVARANFAIHCVCSYAVRVYPVMVGVHFTVLCICLDVKRGLHNVKRGLHNIVNVCLMILHIRPTVLCVRSTIVRCMERVAGRL